VEAFNCEQNIGRIEDCSIFTEPAQMSQVEKEFTTTAVVQNDVEFFRILESKLQLNDKRVRNTFQNSPFRLRPLHLIPLSNLIFFQNFHGKQRLCFLMPHEHYFAVGTCPKDFEGRKVVHRGMIIYLLNQVF
jgi:hypothetical protein